MKKLVLCIGLALFPMPSQAQVDIETPSIEYYKACLNSAIRTHHVKNSQGGIHYSCFGSVAQNWYDILPGGRIVHDGRNGVFSSRSYGRSGYCAQHITSADGTSDPYFVCEIVAAAPDQ